MSETIHTPDIADTTAPIADKGISEEKISALASAINFDDPALTISYGWRKSRRLPPPSTLTTLP